MAQKALSLHRRPRESEGPKLWGWRLLENWARGWPSADQEGRRAKPIPPHPARARKNSKNGLASLKRAEGLFFFKYFFIYFFLLTPPPLFHSFLFYSFFLSYPFLSLLLFFLNSHKLDNKTWNCEKTRPGLKEGASQQPRQ